MSTLRPLQALLSGLYDAPVDFDVEDFLLCDRRYLASVLGDGAQHVAAEQVLMMPDEQGVRIGVFIEQRVLDRLAQHDPLQSLDETNLEDYCTALEGVSHFHYLAWSLTRGRSVSLLELELQAEVDKYATALALLTRQQAGRFPAGLHARLFDAVSFLPHLDEASLRRYEEANRHAARYCRSLDERYLSPRRLRPEMWVAELRRFFRCPRQEKLRQC
jgi:hypothetical protein